MGGFSSKKLAELEVPKSGAYTKKVIDWYVCSFQKLLNDDSKNPCSLILTSFDSKATFWYNERKAMAIFQMRMVFNKDYYINK